MRIKGLGSGKLERITGNNRVGAESSVGKGRSSKAGSSRGRDDVALSEGARIAGQAGEAVQSSPELRMELVQPIKEALASGTYNVSSLDVADKMLRQVLMERKQSL
ncbi:flagellar biosynthesis anti-sigma factor FlgM [Magnetococcus sp. PR-3]|uniref:flagellar biosynthesis anti-sigma factor FlgM n=1 Tax=Magnetococcus sp. PR-3 TaxID=3120355 RepID=UPI002FCE5570